MPNELPTNDSHAIWKNQPTEAFKMSAEQLRHKSEEKQKKARYEALRQMTAGLIVFVLFAWYFVKADGALLRTGLGLISLWGVYIAFVAGKAIWPGGQAPDATASTTLRSYRGELEKRLDFQRRLPLKIVPAFLGMAMVLIARVAPQIASPHLVTNLLPLFILLVAWSILFVVMRKQRRQKLQQEIEQLRLLESEYRP